MDTEEMEDQTGLEQRVRVLEAELESVRSKSVTWGEVLVTVVATVLLVVFFVPAVVLFLTLFAIGACMRLLDAAFPGKERLVHQGLSERHRA